MRVCVRFDFECGVGHGIQRNPQTCVRAAMKVANEKNDEDEVESQNEWECVSVSAVLVEVGTPG